MKNYNNYELIELQLLYTVDEKMAAILILLFSGIATTGRNLIAKNVVTFFVYIDLLKMNLSALRYIKIVKV